MASIFRSLSKRLKSKNTGSSAPYDPRHQLLCKVILLDGTDLNIILDKKALGKDACNKVFLHLDLEETDYFGLTFTDHDNTQHWLDPFKKIRKQIPKGRCATLRLQVKFFSSDPSNLRDEFTRYLFCLQLKNDIKSGKLPCPRQTAIDLAALQLQSEFGDFNPIEHNEIFVSEFRFHSEQDEQMEIEILKKYKTLVGTSPSEAERRYLDVAKNIQFYGVDLHNVVAKDGNEYRLGLTPTGVVVFDNEALVGVLFWQYIQAVNFANRRLTIILDEHSSNEIQQHTFVFTLVSNRSCKLLWKRSVEFHTFYRMRSHRPAKRNAADQFFRLSSSYQHRGRTEFENVNMPMRRERSVVKFERKPSQRYGPRQSHVQRMRNEQNRTMADQTIEPTLFEDSQILALNNSAITNTSFSEQIDMPNASTIPANRTYTISSPSNKLNITTSIDSPITPKVEQPKIEHSTVINTTAQIHPASNGLKFGSYSETHVSNGHAVNGSNASNGEKSVSASAIQPVHSKIPRFGKAKPNIAGPRLYDEAADLVEEANENTITSGSTEIKSQLKAPKTTCIPVSSNRISNPKLITQL